MWHTRHPFPKERLRTLLVAGLVVAGVANEARAGTLTVPFTIGITATTRTVTLGGVPGKTLVSIGGTINALPLTAPPASIPLRIQLFKPEGGTAAATFDVTALPGISLPMIPTVPVLGEVGCSRNWRVDIRTVSGTPPPRAVGGSITFTFFVPGEFPNPLPATYNVDMEGPGLHLEGGGASTTAVLAGHDPILLGIPNRSLLRGTEGRFTIRAKWDTAFHLCYLGRTFPLDVALRRSTATGGTGGAANSENAFSQTSSETNKVRFTYTATPADSLLPGPWRLRVTNNNSVSCGFLGSVPAAIDNFDIENLLPSLVSTFTPQCSQATGSADLTPDEASVEVKQPIKYSFGWTVPEDLNWHHLESLELRLRDDDETILAVVFLEGENQVHLRRTNDDDDCGESGKKGNKKDDDDDDADELGPGFLLGSPHRLETSHATVYLEQSSIVAAGPTSPTVTLNLTISFKPRAAGRTYVVEVGATDKNNAGAVPAAYDELGTVSVRKTSRRFDSRPGVERPGWTQVDQ